MIVAEMVNCEDKTRRYDDLIRGLSSSRRAELRRASTATVPVMLRSRLTKFFVAIGEEIPIVFMSEDAEVQLRGAAT
jgi:hypothetical protein